MFVEKRQKVLAEIPLASMADIAFLLITFFIIITKFGADKGIDLLLPPDGTIKEIPRANIISIVMNDAGGVTVDNTACPLGRVENAVQERTLKNDLLVVTVKTTRRTPYKYFMAVMDQLKHAAVRKISVLEPDH